MKNELLHSNYESDEAQKELRFKCVEDLMEPGESRRMDEVMAREAARLQENAWRKRQIERAIELLKEDCSRPERPQDMKKYRVIMGLYIQDDRMGYEELAESENVAERMIYRDASGMEPQILKTILGHATLSMTMDLYSHVLPDTKAEAMEKAAGAF